MHKNWACLELVVWWPPELVVSQVQVCDVDADQDVVLNDDERVVAEVEDGQVTVHQQREVVVVQPGNAVPAIKSKFN